MAANIETVGVSSKVPVQALVTILVAVLAYFGIDLSAEVSGALAVIVGFAAGYLAPAASIRSKTTRGQVGFISIEAAVAILILVIALVILVSHFG